MAGGKGERFWPLSRQTRPKQLLSLIGGRTLLHQAVERLNGLIPPERIFIITNRDLAVPIRELELGVPAEQVVGEPVGRDTAAAICVGSALIQARDPDGVFCVLTADHVIGPTPIFQRTLAAALELAAGANVLVTLGIRPTSPSTGYGYIEAGAADQEVAGITFHRALRFVEKPDRETAARYLASGLFYWNSGMFVWSAQAFRAALARHRPALAELTERVRARLPREPIEAILADEYPKLEKISIDYALMERADNIVVCRGEFQWDDVGSWPALEGHVPADADGNHVIGECAAVGATGNIVVASNHLVALVGVKDLVVVHTDGATLVCARDRAQDVKQIVERLRADGRHNHLL